MPASKVTSVDMDSNATKFSVERLFTDTRYNELKAVINSHADDIDAIVDPTQYTKTKSEWEAIPLGTGDRLVPNKVDAFVLDDSTGKVVWSAKGDGSTDVLSLTPITGVKTIPFNSDIVFNGKTQSFTTQTADITYTLNATQPTSGDHYRRDVIDGNGVNNIDLPPSIDIKGDLIDSTKRNILNFRLLTQPTGTIAERTSVIVETRDKPSTGITPLFIYRFASDNLDDTSGNANNGTSLVTWTYSSDSQQGDRALDSSSNAGQYIEAPVSSLGDFTRVMLVKISGINNQTLFSCANSTVVNFEQLLIYVGSTGVIRASGSSFAGDNVDTTAITKNVYIMVAQTFNVSTGETKIYINNASPVTGTIATTQVGGNVRMLSVGGNTTTDADFLCDEARYYDSILSDAQILDVYNEYFP